MDVKLSEEAIWYMIKKCVMMGILQAVSKKLFTIRAVSVNH